VPREILNIRGTQKAANLSFSCRKMDDELLNCGDE